MPLRFLLNQPTLQIKHVIVKENRIRMNNNYLQMKPAMSAPDAKGDENAGSMRHKKIINE